MIEINPVLRQKQASMLSGVRDISLHDNIDDVPDGPAIIFANEYFDVLPIHQMVRHENGRTLSRFVLGGVAAAALAGTSIAAGPKTHVMNVPLPDGSTARVEYVGDVAPKVTVQPRRMGDPTMPWAMSFPSFGNFDRIFADMQRRSEEMIRQAQQAAHEPAGPTHPA